jgi:hypothetical protein
MQKRSSKLASASESNERYENSARFFMPVLVCFGALCSNEQQ